MPIDDARFAQAVRALTAARMGTELVGPLLAALVRSTRPELVLEVGSGSTSLHLLRALADNAEAVAAEARLMAAKQEHFDPAWNDEAVARQHSSEVLRWLEAAPSLGRPEYYATAHRPRLISVDLHSSPFSSSQRVARAVEELGLAGWYQPRDRDFRDVAQVLDADDVVDFAWFDCGGYQEYRDFVDLYWDRVRPDGGVLVLHYTLTVPNHERVLTELAAQQGSPARGSFEMLSLLEPHKLMQNSLTMIRRCEGSPPRYPLTRPISLEKSV